MKRQVQKGRKAEIARIRKANRAAAVGRLMLGDFSDWHEFLEADTEDLESLPRRQLKSGAADVKKHVSKEVKKFCARNFENLSEDNLDQLYEEIKAHRGIEIPLQEFEDKYSKIHLPVLKGYPAHSTVVISLWGLQFKFPEDYLAKDVYEALSTAISANEELQKYRKASHRKIIKSKDTISALTRKESHAVRSVLLSCFNLVESYLNGLAWNFAKNEDDFNQLSNRQKKLIQDISQTKLRDKILKYPTIISGRTLWDENDDVVSTFLEIFKPFRDSLVHPSPFSAPEKFGGYDKLSKFYRIDLGIALLTVKITTMLISRIYQNLTDLQEGHPNWINGIVDLIEQVVEIKIHE